jgi:hypothetical protein
LTNQGVPECAAVKLTIRAASGSRVQGPFGLQRIARLRLHNQPKTLQLKSSHRLSSTRSRVPDEIPTSDDCFDNPLSLIRIADLDGNDARFFGRIVIAAREQGVADKHHLFNCNAQDVS